MPETLIHVTTPSPYLETQGHFIEQYVLDPDYAYWQEPYRIALFTEEYAPRFSDIYADVPQQTLSDASPLAVRMEDEALVVEDVIFEEEGHAPTWTWAGFIVWITNPAHTLIMSSRAGFPCRGPLRLHFNCAQLQAQIAHAASDAQCVRELVRAGRLET